MSAPTDLVRIVSPDGAEYNILRRDFERLYAYRGYTVAGTVGLEGNLTPDAAPDASPAAVSVFQGVEPIAPAPAEPSTGYGGQPAEPVREDV